MARYAYSYKLDSSNESIGLVEAKNIDDALILVSEIKRLDIETTKSMFNIRKVENDTKHQS